MSFNSDKFLAAKMGPRTASVSVPNMAAWFDEGETPEWCVQGLEGRAYGHARKRAADHLTLANELNKNPDEIEAKVEVVRTLLGLDPKHSPDIALRVVLMEKGSVEPKCNAEIAVRILKHYPGEFFRITDKINELTIGGAVDQGKQKPSCETHQSEPA